MCNPASFVLTKDKCFWSITSESHLDIIKEHKLHADGVRGPNTVAVEISPPNGNLSLPLAEWKYKCEQDIMPSWYDAADGERRAREALSDWAAKKLSGWNVKEAFNPVSPLQLNPKKLSKQKLTLLLTQWASVQASVRESVWKSVWASVQASVWASVWVSVWASVWESVWESVRESVWESVWESVGAYTGGLFPNIKSWKYAEKLGSDPWRPLLTLWYAGYVPSFDGTTWRLHCGEKAKVVLEIKQADLLKEEK